MWLVLVGLLAQLAAFGRPVVKWSNRWLLPEARLIVAFVQQHRILVILVGFVKNYQRLLMDSQPHPLPVATDYLEQLRVVQQRFAVLWLNLTPMLQQPMLLWQLVQLS
jgi:hypothetical protein